MGLGMEQGTYILGRRDPKQGSATLHLVRRQLWEELLSHFARSSCGFVLGLVPLDTLASPPPPPPPQRRCVGWVGWQGWVGGSRNRPGDPSRPPPPPPPQRAAQAC